MYVCKDLGGGPEHVVDVEPERDHPEAGVAHAARLRTRTQMAREEEDEGMKRLSRNQNENLEGSLAPIGTTTATAQ